MAAFCWCTEFTDKSVEYPLPVEFHDNHTKQVGHNIMNKLKMEDGEIAPIRQGEEDGGKPDIKNEPFREDDTKCEAKYIREDMSLGWLKQKRGRKSKLRCCTVCGEKYKSVEQMNNHNLQEHGGTKCTFCDKVFSGDGSVRQHIKIIHDKERHTCNICEKQFLTKVALLPHTNMHLGLRPYQCDKCESSFRGQDCFSKHKRMHLTPAVTCQVCGKGLYKEAYLESHMKKHTMDDASKLSKAERADAVAMTRYICSTDSVHLKTAYFDL